MLNIDWRAEKYAAMLAVKDYQPYKRPVFRWPHSRTRTGPVALSSRVSCLVWAKMNLVSFKFLAVLLISGSMVT